MEVKDAKFYLRKRYLVAIFIFFGVAFVYAMKANLSVVLVDMTHPKYVVENNKTIYQRPEIEWNSKEVGFIIGASTYGHAPMTFIAGILARKYGGATVFVSGLLLSSVSTLVTPELIRWNFWMFTLARIIDGCGVGLVDCALIEICLNWAPIEERGRVAVTHSTGCAFGIIFSNIVTSYVIYFLNWEAVFYLTGGAVLIFCLVWLILIRNRPEEDKFILEVEKRYLKTKIQVPSDAKTSIFSYPWREILSSKPVWAFINEWFCCGWSSSFILYCLPLYVKDVLKSDTRTVALMSSIPIVCSMISEFGFSYIGDYIRSHGTMNISKMHQIFLSIGHFGIALCLFGISFWTNIETSFVLLSLINFLFGIKWTSYHSLPIDAFYRYAAIVKSLGLGCYCLTNCFSPLLMGFIVTNHERSEWSLYFGLLVIFNFISIIVFYRYGSGDLQPWAVSPSELKKQTETEGQHK